VLLRNVIRPEGPSSVGVCALIRTPLCRLNLRLPPAEEIPRKDANRKVDEDLQPSHVLLDLGVLDYARVGHGTTPQSQSRPLPLLRN